MKTLFAAALITIFAAPAFADDMMMATKCDDASIMKAEDHAKMMTGKTMDMAMKEVDMAKKDMKSHKMKGCMKHIDKAMMSK